MCDERMRGQPLQAHFAIAVADNPDDAELGFDLAHLDIENFTGSNLSHHALNYQAAHAHVRDEAGMSKRLAVGIHSPNLYRKLNFNSWALASIHEDIVRHNRLAENLPGLPQPEYWSVEECCVNSATWEWPIQLINRGQAWSKNRAREGLHSCRRRRMTRLDSMKTFACTANTESCDARFLPWHFGQLAFSFPE